VVSLQTKLTEHPECLPEEGLAALLAEAREDERKRLSRDLHDGLCQKLGYLLFSWPGDMSASESSSRWMAQARISIEDVLDEVRSIAHGLHPSILDHLGLVAAMELLAGQYSAKSQALRVECHAEGSYPQGTSLALYRIAQEALSNAARHARARRVSLGLQIRNDWAEIEICDDGIGFRRRPEDRAGLGLQSMMERARLAGGSCEITERAGGGVRVFARLPLGCRSGQGEL
jgi:signal transduction histidine kinase